MSKVLTTVTEAQNLLADLVSRERKQPLCLISTQFNSETTQFDLRELRDQVGDLAKIVVIKTGEPTFDLSNNLAAGLGVFGGAARVYPPGFTVNTSQHLPLIYPENNGLSKLIEQVWVFADFASVRKDQLRGTKELKAIVKQVLPSEGQSRVIVETSQGDLSTIREELVYPNTPLEWVFKPGDEIDGFYNPELKTYVPSLRFVTIQDLLPYYQLDSIIPVFVSSVEPSKAQVVIYPGIVLQIHISEISGNPLDKVTDFLDVGEVVGMRFCLKSDNSYGLRMDDIDDDEKCSEAVPIFERGMPWIEEGRNHLVVKTPSTPASHTKTNVASFFIEEPEIPSPVPGPGLVKGLPVSATKPQPLSGKEKSDFEYHIKHLKGVIAALAQEIDELKAETSRLESEKLSLSNTLNAARKAATSARRKGQKVIGSKSSPSSRRNRFQNDDEWFREEIRRAWISNYAAADRSQKYILDNSKFSFGDVFFRSIKESNCDEEDLRKVIRCILDLVTGRENVEPRHNVHPLRSGEGAAAKDIVDNNGSIALRAYIEENTPAAKRIHYWTLANRHLEIVKVVTHDIFSM